MSQPQGGTMIEKGIEIKWEEENVRFKMVPKGNRHNLRNRGKRP